VDSERITTLILNELGLIKFDCGSSVLLEHHIDLAVLFESNVGPGAPVLLDRPPYDHALPVLAPLAHLQVMVALQRIHQPRILQSVTARKQRFTQILRRLYVFQVAHEKLSSGDFGTEVFHAMRPVIREDYDFINLEEPASFSYLAHKVGLQLKALSVIDD